MEIVFELSKHKAMYENLKYAPEMSPTEYFEKLEKYKGPIYIPAYKSYACDYAMQVAKIKYGTDLERAKKPWMTDFCEFCPFGPMPEKATLFNCLFNIYNKYEEVRYTYKRLIENNDEDFIEYMDMAMINRIERAKMIVVKLLDIIQNFPVQEGIKCS